MLGNEKMLPNLQTDIGVAMRIRRFADAKPPYELPPSIYSKLRINRLPSARAALSSCFRFGQW